MYVLAAAILWGTTGTAQALAPAGTPPLAVGAVRMAVGGVALLGLAAARGALRGGARWPPLATALAAGTMAAYQPLFFAGVARTGVAVGTIVAIGSAPVFAGILGRAIRGDQPGRRWRISTALAVLGCALLVAASGTVGVDGLGVLLALAAGLAYAGFAVSSKGLLEDHPPDAVTAVVFCLAALLLAPIWLWADLRWLAQPRGLAVALHLGLVATAVAYTLFARGLRVVPVATAVSLSLAEPLTAGLLGMVVLGERLTMVAVLGAGLMLAGLVTLATGTEGTEGERE
jgi:DME family drug/metabolite transporter